MAININNGVLDIVNGVLRVSSINVKGVGSSTSFVNALTRNDILFDDQKATTGFMSFQHTGSPETLNPCILSSIMEHTRLRSSRVN